MSSKLDYLKKYGAGNSKEDVKKRLMKALNKDNTTHRPIVDDDQQVLKFGKSI
jgi:hypothetical protein